MKLYSANLSPYAAVARMAVYAKALPLEIVLPPGGLKSPEYLALNPLGKVPCLELDDGSSIPESMVIAEYLDDAFPDTPLRPTDPKAAARVRLVARIGELYVMEPMRALFGQLDPSSSDPAVVERALGDMDVGLGRLERFIGDDGFAAGGRFSLADCQLPPTLFYVAAMSARFRRDLMAERPRLSAYFAAIRQHPATAKILAEMQAAVERFRASGEIT